MNFKEYLTVVKNKHCTFPFKYHERREHYINIDSESRDISKYSNPNTYRIDLSKEGISDVIKVELINTLFINNNLTINDTNNTLFVTINGVNHTISLENGLYVIDDIRFQLETQLNNIGDEFSFSVDVVDLRLQIRAFYKEEFTAVSSTAGSNQLVVVPSNGQLLPNQGTAVLIVNVQGFNDITHDNIIGYRIVSSVSLASTEFVIDMNEPVSPSVSETGTINMNIPFPFSLTINNASTNLGFDTLSLTDTLLADNKLTIYEDQYFYMCCPQLAGNFSTTGNVQNTFAKINIVGDNAEPYLNSYVGGTRIFDDPIHIKNLDFSFAYDNNTLVDFDSTQHNFVLKVTCLIHKIDNGNNDPKELYRLLYTIMNQIIKS